MTYYPTRKKARVRRDGLGGIIDSLKGVFATDDDKRAAGCTPLEIVAASGTPPYQSCQDRLAARAALTSAGSSSAGGAATTATGAGKSTGSDIASLFGALLSNATKPATPAPVYVQPSGGMSTTALVAIGALGLGILYVATK